MCPPVLPWSVTVDCPCETWTGLQTPVHVLQSCPLYKETQTQHWPQGIMLAADLSKEGLVETSTSLINTIKLEWMPEDNPEMPKSSNTLISIFTHKICLVLMLTWIWKASWGLRVEAISVLYGHERNHKP